MSVLANFFFNLSNLSRKVANRFSANDQWRRLLHEWKLNGGYNQFRLTYDHLNSNSVVFDLGGFEGQWASDIFAKYRSRIVIFEPYCKYAESITNRFNENESIEIHQFGLGSKDAKLEIGVDSDSTSIFKKGSETAEISLKKASDFLESDYQKIDLMKINIEGAEYDLLDHLIEEGLTSRITDIQIQFHHFVPNAEARMKAIQDRLRETHELTYEYEFFWENWRLKTQD